MKRFGSKKASRPYERIHAVKRCHGHVCGECLEYCEIKTKSGRRHEKRMAERQIKEQLSEVM